MRPEHERLIVLGLGNVLCGDDGLGVVATRQLLKRYSPPHDTLVVDGGTLGMTLLSYFDTSHAMILVDAVRDTRPPGSLVCFEGDEVASAAAERLSSHQVGVVDLLDAARWSERYPKRIVLVGLVPQTLALGVRQSPIVAAQIDRLVDRVVKEARLWGRTFRPRTETQEVHRPAGFAM